MKHDPSVWKKEFYCGTFRLYLGGQYTEAIVMGRCWPSLGLLWPVVQVWHMVAVQRRLLWIE